MMTRDPCECRGCSEVRMLAAWCLLEECEDPKTRVAARLLMRRWERVLENGESPTVTPPRPHELEALVTCADWIREHKRTLARMNRHVGVAGAVRG